MGIKTLLTNLAEMIRKAENLYPAWFFAWPSIGDMVQGRRHERRLM
jgi:hypothetical protein